MPNSDQKCISENISHQFWVGIEQFNGGDYYACHDTLEALWMEAPEVNRAFYQGILQIAVGFYHLTHDNGRGATLLLGEGSQRLIAYESDYGGINVTELIDLATHWLNALQAALEAALQSGNAAQVQELSQRLCAQLGSGPDPRPETGHEGETLLAKPKINRTKN